MAKRKNGEGTWGKKTIKGVEYQYYRNPNGKYYYAKTIKELKAKVKADKENTFNGYMTCIKGQIINYSGHNLNGIQVGTLTADILQEYYKSTYLLIFPFCVIKDTNISASIFNI